MTDQKLKPCPFCGGEATRNDGKYNFGGDYFETGCDNVGCMMLPASKCLSRENADAAWNIRATQTQPPVIEGLDEAIFRTTEKLAIHCDCDDAECSVCKTLCAAKLYAQGQTAQTVDIESLKRETNETPYWNIQGQGEITGWNKCLEAVKAHLASRGMIVTAQDGFDKLVEMLDREPQYKPRLAALLREDSVFDKQPTEDAQDADTLPCVSCERPSDTSTPDDAQMCWECMANHNGIGYIELADKMRALFPDVDEEILLYGSAADIQEAIKPQDADRAGALDWFEEVLCHALEGAEDTYPEHIKTIRAALTAPPQTEKESR